MKPYIIVPLLLGFLFFSSSYVLTANADGDGHTENDSLPYVEIKPAKDFSLLTSLAGQSDKVIMLEVTASNCSYCTLLEEEIIKPMLRSGDYTKTALIRQLEMDSSHPVKDFHGDEILPAMLAKAYKVKLTPTLLFLDSNGNEVAERILGVYSLDFFGYYVDEALTKSLKTIRLKKAL